MIAEDDWFTFNMSVLLDVCSSYVLDVCTTWSMFFIYVLDMYVLLDVLDMYVTYSMYYLIYLIYVHDMYVLQVSMY